MTTALPTPTTNGSIGLSNAYHDYVYYPLHDCYEYVYDFPPPVCVDLLLTQEEEEEEDEQDPEPEEPEKHQGHEEEKDTRTTVVVLDENDTPETFRAFLQNAIWKGSYLSQVIRPSCHQLRSKRVVRELCRDFGLTFRDARIMRALRFNRRECQRHGWADLRTRIRSVLRSANRAMDALDMHEVKSVLATVHKRRYNRRYTHTTNKALTDT